MSFDECLDDEERGKLVHVLGISAGMDFSLQKRSTRICNCQKPTVFFPKYLSFLLPGSGPFSSMAYEIPLALFSSTFCVAFPFYHFSLILFNLA